jgi:hypothetical protein
LIPLGLPTTLTASAIAIVAFTRSSTRVRNGKWIHPLCLGARNGHDRLLCALRRWAER